MRKFTAEDTNPMTWEEVDRLIDVLVSKISASGVEMNVIAPLLRTGGIPGGILAIKMRVHTMLPVQFKYVYNPTAIQQILSVPIILTAIPDPMNILLCEGNTNSGSIAAEAALAIRRKYPKANIYLATLTKVYGGPEKLEEIREIFYGIMTDENFIAADDDERGILGLRKGITIFPWEDVDNELADINAIR